VRIGFIGEAIVVSLADGREVRTPLSFYPTLFKAPRRERSSWRWLARGRGVEWPGLDLQLSVASIVAGRREHIPPADWRSGLAGRLEAYRAGKKRSGRRAA
jgi:hypothetical protein